MRSVLTPVICSIVTSLSCSPYLVAADKAQTIERMQCTKEQLGYFFPKVVVKAVLMKNGIPEDQADDIAASLEGKDVAQIVREKAAQLNPNPLEGTHQRDVGIKMYREGIFNEFAKVLRAHGINDDDRIQGLLDEIQRTKSKTFIDCVRNQNPDFFKKG